MLLATQLAVSLLLPLPSRSSALLRCRCPHPPRCVAGTYDSDDWRRWGSASSSDDAKDDKDDSFGARRWLRIAECDVLPPPSGERCAGIVHFVGGALVGAAPKQGYASFLEGVSDAANLCIVATPCTGLTGLDHWAAASEVLLRWCAAQTEVRSALDERPAGNVGACASDQLPVLGLGHSLGAKLLVLLGSDGKMAEQLGERCANVLVSYNSFSAKRSVPLLQQAVTLGDGLRTSGIAGAAGPIAGTAATSLGEIGETLGAGASDLFRGLGQRVGTGEVADTIDALADGLGLGSLGDALGGGGTGRRRGGAGDGDGERYDEVAGASGGVAEQLAFGLDGAARALGVLGRGVGEAGRSAAGFADRMDEGTAEEDSLPDEFSPSPEETSRLVSTSYRVGRNLLVRFGDDPLDESSGLARLLKARFTDDVTGIGGRLDFKRLEGTHVTPNTPDVAPYLDGLDWSLAEQLGAAEAARALERASLERDEASEAVAAFAWREVKRGP
jgi:hypothetical protein